MMAAGEVDMMTSLRVTKERAEHIDFLSVTNGVSSILFYTKKSDGDWLTEYSDLKGKTLGTSNGYLYTDKFDGDDSIKKFKTNDFKQLLHLLEAGRIDAYIVHSGAIGFEGGHEEILKSDFSIPIPVSFLGLARNSPLQAHRALIDETIKALLKDGTYERLKRKHVLKI